MEMWFIYALLGVLTSGLHAFLIKVAVMRKYDSHFINAATGLIATLITASVITYQGTWLNVTQYAIFLGMVGGILYVPQAVLRLEALRWIDTTIFFPLYKVIGPALATMFGVFLMLQPISHFEIIGVILTCIVPILLITPGEVDRQKKLWRGVLLTVLATTIAATTIFINAVSVRAEPAAMLHFLLIAELITVLVSGSFFVYGYRNGERTLPKKDAPVFVGVALLSGILSFFAFYFVLLSLAGGDLAVAYSINAHYILIPVLLSVWMYKEHWNLQKAAALFLSIASIIFMHY